MIQAPSTYKHPSTTLLATDPTAVHLAHDASIATWPNSNASSSRTAARQMGNVAVLQALVPKTVQRRSVVHWRMARTGHQDQKIKVLVNARKVGLVSTAMSVPRTKHVML